MHGLGARVAFDDFGAGFTSFRNLRLLGVDMVKIDGSFVERLADSPDDQIFVRRLTELARDLGIETVAEWVQDEQAAALLAGWGVERIQGQLSGEATIEGRPGWCRPQAETEAAMRSIASASARSSAVSPPASCVVRTTSTLR